MCNSFVYDTAALGLNPKAALPTLPYPTHAIVPCGYFQHVVFSTLDSYYKLIFNQYVVPD